MLFNLKQMSKTLIVTERNRNSIDFHDDLREKVSAASGEFQRTDQRLKRIESQQNPSPSFRSKSGLRQNLRCLGKAQSLEIRLRFLRCSRRRHYSSWPKKSILTRSA
jgi:hypothetical protein